ncbi:MAG: tellurite resistance protein [Gammaproteobacteria bacterium]|nr:tellurite resistance protein [Gammaproteobacteria bacterium]|tara:strand:+ start:650 stop:1252 length:603 start_codon:yes stop_codon:yes gene_type:complete
MPSAAISRYFDETENRRIREDLVFAVDNVAAPRVAIDCGCGAGADIHYLAANGFTVHGFDVEEESIQRCKRRFRGIENVKLSRSSFTQYKFPKASLVIADASFFFCPKKEFPDVWTKVYECLHRGGVFSGSFLGPEDTMAGSEYNREDFWPDVAIYTEEEVQKLFVKYEVLRFNEHRLSGTAPGGEPHDWHIYSVVAKKI